MDAQNKRKLSLNNYSKIKSKKENKHEHARQTEVTHNDKQTSSPSEKFPKIKLKRFT